jgi:hypothetical protein
MADMDTFERLVSEEVQVEAGPSRPTDVAAVIRSAAAQSSRWRSTSMFSATKFAAASVVMVLVGGILLAGPLTTPNGSTPGAATQAVAPEAFTGHWQFEGDGFAVEVTDPRLDGVVEDYHNSRFIGDLGVTVYNRAFRIENDEGSWVEEPTMLMLLPGDEGTTTTTKFVGEGAYEGLMAIMEIDWKGWRSGTFDLRGIITPGPAPDAPVVPETP